MTTEMLALITLYIMLTGMSFIVSFVVTTIFLNRRRH